MVSLKGSYAKVEVVRSGEVGYVTSIMLGEKRLSNQVPLTPTTNDNTNNKELTPDISPELVDPSRPAE